MKLNLQKIFAPYKDIVRYNEPMSKHTSFHIGGRAEVFITPKNLSQLSQIYRLCCQKRIPIHILGRGTNLLVNDRGVKGVVLKPDWMNLERKGTKITVSPDYPLARLVQKSAKMGLSGLEPLVGIPGSVAGAVVMNAGGKYGQMADIVKSVKVIAKDGRIKTVNRIRFAYRWSNLKGRLIAEVTLQLKTVNSAMIRSRIRAILNEKRQTQPLADWSAGCVFTNPNNYSAGALIDRAGLKGLSIGGAKISAKHANFIVNTGKAKAEDVVKLINIIKRTVHKKVGVNLELEIERW
ncbi:MAG: UDP-N-acetylmuramate dehydrogenase [Planctomycetes bacterium]|nr:UDP-N-acetylmuramate dehydrogenase [Planctomycetota bacterium]